MKEIAAKVRSELSSILSDVMPKFGGAVSLDCWLDKAKKMTFFGFTIHFITEDENGLKLHDRILATRELVEDKKTGDYLCEQISLILKEFNLDKFVERDIVFVSDRGSNIVKALHNYQSVNCFAHMVHNTVCNMLDSWKETLTKVKRLVKYFKVTGANAQLTTCLKSFVSTRWNSVFFMLETVILMWDEIIIALENRGELNRLAGINKEELTHLCNFLGHFKECTSEIEASRTPTLHLVLPWYYELRRYLSCDYLDVAFIGKMKMVGRKYLDENVGLKLNCYHEMATFLHPALKRLTMFDSAKRTSIYNTTKGFLMKYDQTGNIQRTSTRQHNTHTHLHVNKVSKAMARFMSEPTSTNVNEIETGHAEVERYIASEPCDHVDVLNYWHTNKHIYPRLYRLAKFLYSIPASSASVERVFSTAGHCVKDRPNLKGTRLHIRID